MFTRLSCVAVALVLTVGGTGCAYHYSFRTGLEPEEDEVVKEWKHIGLWGWIEPSPFDLDEACPDGVAEFGSYVSFPNWFFALATAGLYSPRTAFAVPVRGSRPRSEFNEAAFETIAVPSAAPRSKTIAPSEPPPPARSARPPRPRDDLLDELDELERAGAKLFD